jgi:hypothetical protein
VTKKRGDCLTKKKISQTRAGVSSALKKTRSKGKKATVSVKASSQTYQPYEQDQKRRIGQFGGTGEPPLMKK